MTTAAQFRRAVRDWVVTTSGRVRPEELNDDTPIIERRIITSLQVMDLVLFLEELTGDAIDVAKLRVGVFRDINAICQNFFTEGAHAS